MFCIQCGKKNPVDARFCFACGNAVAEAAASELPRAAAADSGFSSISGVAVSVPPRYAAPIPRERVYREDEDDDYPRPRRYSYADPVPPYAARCLPRAVIKDKLIDHGWSDFHDGDLRGDVAIVHARRPSGRLFLLKIDRCSGDILSARPLEGRFGPYAHGPRRWERFY